MLLTARAVLCVWCVVQCVFGFNIEPRIPVIKQGPAFSHFGYSVAMHKSVLPGTPTSLRNRYTPWMLVGAPKGENLQPGTNHSGALYKCPLTSYSDDCEQVLTDGLKGEDGKILPPADYEIKDDQWMGVTVKSQGEGGYILVCAHRYQRKGLAEETWRWGYGLCYRLTNTFEFEDNYEPCLGKPVNTGYKQFGYCQAGTSGMILEDEILLGVPGTHSWRGTVYSTNISSDYLRRDKTQYFGVYVDDQSPVEKFSYLGYAVAAGKFYGDGLVIYVAGAPRAGGTGEVVFFQKEKIGSPVMPYLLKLEGETLASSFGHELIVQDVNGDGLDDLIISAPFYFDDLSSGAVYIYLNEGLGVGIKSTTKPTRILGPGGESRFGHSLAALGDINLDGFNDVAVGAPYDKKGAIFIYLGSKDGLQTTPSQVIRSEDVPGSNEAFGYALSGGMDLDNNGYNDLLTSSFCSDKVMLLRARPVMDIHTRLRPDESELVINPTETGCDVDRDTDEICFSFATCFRIKSEGGSITYLQFRYNISERFYSDQTSSRIRFQDANQESPGTIEKPIQLEPRDMLKEVCTPELVYVKKEQTDFLRPIRFKLTYEAYKKKPRLVDEGEPLPDVNNYPILNQKEAVIYFQASFAKDCGDDDICNSDLKVTATQDLPKLPHEDVFVYELDTSEDNRFLLNVTVTNEGEPAYLPYLYISHNKVIDLKRSETNTEPYTCVPASTELIVCKLDNPLVNTTGVLSLVFKKSGLPFEKSDIKDGAKGAKRFPLRVWANSTSDEIDLSNNEVKYIIEVKKRAEVSIRGFSLPEQVNYQGEIKGESGIDTLEEIGREVLHEYQVVNGGPGKVEELQVKIWWPYQVENQKEEGKWLLYMTDIPEVSQAGGECDVPSSHINPLGKPSAHRMVQPEATYGGSQYAGQYGEGGSSATTITKTTKTTKITSSTKKKTVTSESSSSGTSEGNKVNKWTEEDEQDYNNYDTLHPRNRAETSQTFSSSSSRKVITTDSNGVFVPLTDRIGRIRQFKIEKYGDQYVLFGLDRKGMVIWSSGGDEVFDPDLSTNQGDKYDALESEQISKIKNKYNVEVKRDGDESFIVGYDKYRDVVYDSRNRQKFMGKGKKVTSSKKEYSYTKKFSSKNGDSHLQETWTGPDGERHRSRSWSSSSPSQDRFDWDKNKTDDNLWRTDDDLYRNNEYRHGSTYSRAVVESDGSTNVYTRRRENDLYGNNFRSQYDGGEYRRRRSIRVKREEVIKAQAITDSETGRTLKVVNFRCDGENPTAKCFTFVCTIRNLDKQTSRKITIRSRIWNATLIEDYPRVNYVSIQSKGVLILPEDIRANQDTSDDEDSAETIALSSMEHPSEGVPWWVILVSVLAGLLLLVLIAVILWKMGFFKRRRRPDPTLSGNIHKNGY